MNQYLVHVSRLDTIKIHDFMNNIEAKYDGGYYLNEGTWAYRLYLEEYDFLILKLTINFRFVNRFPNVRS